MTQQAQRGRQAEQTGPTTESTQGLLADDQRSGPRPEAVGLEAPPAVPERTGQAILPAFDTHRPPAVDLVDDCVHCGFCLPTCPTYVLWGEEMDSPRGRIHLMKQALEGEPLTDTMVRHFDLCLGCMACVTACPSGVQYDRLIEATRAQVERRYERTRGDRVFRALIFQLFPHRRRMALARGPLRLYQRLGLGKALRRTGVFDRLPARLRTLESLLPDVAPPEPVPAVTPAAGPLRRRVGLLTGCVQQAFFSPVNASTARVLAAEGCEVVAPEAQGCCGALSMHAGREAEARVLAKRIIATFESSGVEDVVVNVAGCGSTMKEYGDLLADEPGWAERAATFSERVLDVSEVLADLEPVAPRHPLPIAIAYHDACHLAHAQGVTRQPRAVLRQIPGIELKEIREAALCCGSAGIWNLVEPDPAIQLGERKAANAAATGADLLVTSNPGCLLQLQASLRRSGHHLPTAHLVEVVDASMRGLDAQALTGDRLK